MKSSFTTVEFPVFGDYIIHVEKTSDLNKSLLKYRQTKNIDISNADALTVHDSDDSFTFIFLKYNASVGTIAHECWHAVKHMLDDMGVELDSETVAYHLGYLVNKVFRFMRGRKCA